MSFRGRRLLVVGCGSIAASVLPLLFRHVAIRPDQVRILAPDACDADTGRAEGIRRETLHLAPETHRAILAERLAPGDCLLNLSGGVSSRALVRACLERGIDYLDTSNERWEHGAGGDGGGDLAEQWRLLMAERDRLPRSATALVSHGANPGLVSHFAKRAVEELAAAEGLAPAETPRGRDWARMARALGIEALHVCERDTQEPRRRPGPRAFLNTWSVESLIEEADADPCIAWGSHERPLPGLETRRDPAAWVARLPGPARRCLLRSWLPGFGAFEGAMIPHEETFSIAGLLSEPAVPGGPPAYQPTVLFAYRPCDAAWEALHDPRRTGRTERRVMAAEIARGVDELGVLLLRRGTREVFWYGSTVEIAAARRLVGAANATSLQVAAGVIGGLVWLLESPRRGLVAPEDADAGRVLGIARPYLGELRGVRGRWQGAPGSWRLGDLMAAPEAARQPS